MLLLGFSAAAFVAGGYVVAVLPKARLETGSGDFAGSNSSTQIGHFQKTKARVVCEGEFPNKKSSVRARWNGDFGMPLRSREE